MKSHAKSRAGQYRKMALALSLVLGVSPLQADTTIEPAQDSPVAALLRRAVETNLEQLPADLAKFKAHYLELLEMHRSSAHGKATHLVTNCNNSGAGSLRAAVAAASSGDTVDLSGLSCTTITLTESIVTNVGSLMIKDDAGVREISGGNSIRPITHNGSGMLALDGVSVIKGKHTGGIPYGASGGCIYSKGNVALNGNAQARDCEAIGALSAKGGGIFAYGNVTLLDGATVKQNRAVSEEGVAQGGGVFAASRIEMQMGVIEANEARGRVASGGGVEAGGIWAKYSTVRNNKAVAVGDWDASYATGGGMLIDSRSEESSIHSVTISGNSVKSTGVSSNTAWVSGAGARILGIKTVISSSTIADNVGEGRGMARGALAVDSDEVIIRASTISGNKTLALLQGSERRWGAGITLQHNKNLEVHSSIVAGNHVVSGSGQSLASDVGIFWPDANVSTQMIGDCNFVNYHHPDIFWSSPNNDILPAVAVNLESLRDNGGFNLTMMPRASSPVINKGLDFGLDYDQRGGGYARVYGPRADIGAVERGSIHMGIFHDHFEDE